jgi:hypothetical protein
MAEDQIEPHLDELAREIPDSLGVARAPAVLDLDVAPVAPAEFLQRSGERGHEGWPGRIALGNAHEHADAPRPLALLRVGRERPRRRAAEQRDEFAPFHSITSSASASNLSGRPELEDSWSLSKGRPDSSAPVR